MTNVGHDQTALTEAQLRSVIRSDPDTLDKSQHVDQPVHRSGNIRIGELGDHWTKRGRAIRSHHRKGTPRRAAARSPAFGQRLGALGEQECAEEPVRRPGSARPCRPDRTLGAETIDDLAKCGLEDR